MNLGKPTARYECWVIIPVLDPMQFERDKITYTATELVLSYCTTPRAPETWKPKGVKLKGTTPSGVTGTAWVPVKNLPPWLAEPLSANLPTVDLKGK